MWLASSEPGPEELDELEASFDLPPRAVQDARDGHQRPKLDQYGERLYLVVKTLRYDEVTTHSAGGTGRRAGRGRRRWDGRWGDDCAVRSRP